MALKRGDKAPEILGVDQAGKEIRLSDFAGSKLILYFYPKDNTPGCTGRSRRLAGSLRRITSIGLCRDRREQGRRGISSQVYREAVFAVFSYSRYRV